MINNLQVFRNTEFGEIVVLVVDGRELFPATECARMLGYSDPYDAINRHTRGSVKHRVLTTGGEQEIKFIPEGDLFRLIVKSKLAGAERFERWIFDEVLPAIRKHGIYATDKIIDDMIADPDYGIRLFTELKKERQKRKALEYEIEKNTILIKEMEPKASYYDLILQSKSLMSVTQIAKDYGMSAVVFNQLLHSLGVQFKQGEQWHLYQRYASYGYTQSRAFTVGEDKSKLGTYWTQKGRLFIYDLLINQCGIFPVIEIEEILGGVI